MRSDHPLFAEYPLDAVVPVDGEDCTSPYHIYNGDLVLIGGRADAAAAADLLAGERLAPMLDSAGNALMAVWLADFTEANLGPHHELQISLFAALTPQPPTPQHPFAIHRLLLLEPDAYMVCHGLWNSTQRVVRYNQSHLCLDARLSNSRIDRDDRRGMRSAEQTMRSRHDSATADLMPIPPQWNFQVSDALSGQAVAEGSLALPNRQPLSVSWAMLRHLGMAGMMQSARQPFIHVPVVNTKSAYADDNYVAHTYTRSDRQIIRRREKADAVSIRHQRYAPLNFQPDFVQHSAGVRFVYLRPQPLDAAV